MFSVVIPLYNKELSIKDTLESVLSQTFSNFEIVIVNDGSTDGSVQVVEQIRDQRIRIIHQKNQGVSAARNRGVREAKNDWIAFLDGDDLWLDNHLSEVVKMTKTFPDEKVFVTSFKYSDKRYMYKHPRADEIFKINNYFQEALKEYLICTDVIVIHKESFEKSGGFKENLNRGEDLDLWGRLAKEYDIVKSSKITAIYRIDAENRSNKTLELIKTRVFNYDFSLSESIEETRYYRAQIIRSLKSMIKNGDLRNFVLLWRKHSQYITWFDIIRNK